MEKAIIPNFATAKFGFIFFILSLFLTSFSYADSNLKQKISEVESLYNKAVINYEKGDFEKSEKLYKKAMHKLYSCNLDADINYQLREEFDNLFAKIDEVLKNLNASSLEISKEELEKTGSLSYDTLTATESVKSKYTIPVDKNDEMVKKYIKLYTEGKRKKIINETLERSRIYCEMMLDTLRESNLPEELFYLSMVESLYKVNAYSRMGACGLWQLMPKTARNLGLKVNYWIDERKDPEKSTRAALKYLKELYTWFNDWHLALAAYNRGESGIGRDLKFSKATSFTQLQKREALPRETKHFIPKFAACVLIGDNFSDYGFSPNFKSPPEFDEVTVNDVIDLEIVAKCADSKVSQIRKLNPQLRVWCTPKNYPDFKLRLPYGTKDKFLEKIKKVKNLNPSRGFIKYRVKKGDCLSKIAKKFRTTSYAIKRDNRIRNVNFIRPKQVLVIRPGRKYYLKK